MVNPILYTKADRDKFQSISNQLQCSLYCASHIQYLKFMGSWTPELQEELLRLDATPLTPLSLSSSSATLLLGITMPCYNSTDYRMNPEAKSLWIELMLTTYRDRQCKGAAVHRTYGADYNHYCVMGMLAVAYAIAHGHDPDTYATHHDICRIPTEVFTWAGVNNRNGMYKPVGGEYSTLTTQNDIGCTFPGLVKIIQENF